MCARAPSRSSEASRRHVRVRRHLRRRVRAALVCHLRLHLPRAPPGDAMRVDLYEKIWMWGVAVMLSLFFTSTAIAALRDSRHPPSHVETIDPTRVMADARFRAPGVSVDVTGRVQARIVGMTFAWLPAEITVPAETPVTFRVTSM